MNPRGPRGCAESSRRVVGYIHDGDHASKCLEIRIAGMKTERVMEAVTVVDGWIDL